jgi:hypothetical protein
MKRFTPVQPPGAVIVLPRAEAHRLQVAARVRLGQHHRAGDLALGELGQILVLEPVVGERVDRLGDALQAEDVHQRGIGPADHLHRHSVDQIGAIQSAVPPRQGEPHQVGLGQGLEVLADPRAQRDRSVVVQAVALVIDLLAARSDTVGRDIADDLEDAAIVVDGISRIHRSERIVRAVA